MDLLENRTITQSKKKDGDKNKIEMLHVKNTKFCISKDAGDKICILSVHHRLTFLMLM